MRRPAIWQIVLAIFLVLVAIPLLSNIAIVWMSVLTGIAAVIAAICILVGK